MSTEKKKLYRVTDAGGTRPDVAGKRRRVGDEILLNATEAEFEVSRGTIEEIKPGAKAKAEK